MIRSARILWLAAASLAAAGPPAEEKPDFIRFTNGDTFHGSYLGMKTGPLVSWRRDDMAEAVDFKTAGIRQIVLRGGRPLKSHGSLAHVALVNGDRLPGRITGLDEKHVTLETVYAGEIRVPREQVGMIAPNPLGGRVLYHGPYDGEGWEFGSLRQYPKALPAPGELPLMADEGKDADAPRGEEETAPLWALSGAAWYWHHQRGGTALFRRSGMEDRSVLRFKLAWRSRLSFCVAFHADFQKPEAQDELEAVNRFGPGESSSFPGLFGNSYVIQFFPSQVILNRVGYDENDMPVLERVQAASSNVRIGDAGEATVEIRCNRTAGEISLFIDDEFATQWSEGAAGDLNGYVAKGDGFGFIVPAENSPVRVSDIVLAEWNGMPDSARSLQTDEQDIVLLTNGTDRFSGKITGLSDGHIHLSGRYGEFRFPLDEVAEVRFAKNTLAEVDESADQDLILRLHPLGRLSGKPLSGEDGLLKMLTPSAGALAVSLDSVVMLDFKPSKSFLDDWDPPF